MEVKIKFDSGDVIVAEQNGESFITEQKPSFPADMGLVTVDGTDGVRTYKDPQIVECASVDGRYWFCFVEESTMQKRIRQLEEKNDALLECLLEMSEIVYA